MSLRGHNLPDDAHPGLPERLIEGQHQHGLRVHIRRRCRGRILVNRLRHNGSDLFRPGRCCVFRCGGRRLCRFLRRLFLSVRRIIVVILCAARCKGKHHQKRQHEPQQSLSLHTRYLFSYYCGSPEFAANAAVAHVRAGLLEAKDITFASLCQSHLLLFFSFLFFFSAMVARICLIRRDRRQYLYIIAGSR